MTEPDDENLPWRLLELQERYGHGLIRLATYLRHLPDGQQEARLLFGGVELLPVDIEPPSSIGWITSDSLNSLGDHSDRLFYACAVTTPETALRWYQACRLRGIWHQPDRKLNFDFRDEEKSHPLTPLMEEPAWPDLSLNISDRQLPVVPRCWDLVSTHHLLASDDDWRTPWLAEEQESALNFLSDVLAFEIREWNELLGSIHLIVPDPWLRKVRVGFDDTTGELTVGIDPRTGVDVPELHLFVWQRRMSGIDRSFDGAAGAGEHRVCVGDEPREIGVAVSSSDGLLAFVPPVAFMKSVSFNLSLASPRTVRVEGFDEDIEYSAPRMLHQDTIVGEPAKPGGSRVLALGRDRRRVAAAAQDSQFWFDGELDRAHNLIRRLIGRARERVLIVDPYFEAEAAMRFCPAVSNSKVTVQILTSHAFLREKVRVISPESPWPRALKIARRIRDNLRALTGVNITRESSGTVKREELLVRALTSLREEGFSNFEVRRLAGRDKAPVHDRLLVVDDVAWLLGSSLKDFGARGTMLVKLPEPEGVVDIVKGYWGADDTVNIEETDGESETS